MKDECWNAGIVLPGQKLDKGQVLAFEGQLERVLVGGFDLNLLLPLIAECCNVSPAHTHPSLEGNMYQTTDRIIHRPYASTQTCKVMYSLYASHRYLPCLQGSRDSFINITMIYKSRHRPRKHDALQLCLHWHEALIPFERVLNSLRSKLTVLGSLHV